MSFFESVKVEPGSAPVVTTINGNVAVTSTPNVDSGIYDAFGRARMSLPVSMFHSMTLSGNGSTAWSELETGTANGSTSAWTQNTASVLLTVNSSTNTQRLRQSFARFAYTPGKSQEILISCIPGTQVVGITKEIGYGDDNDGIFLSNNGTAWGWTLRSRATGTVNDTFVPQTSWSMDTMNGAGASGLTLNFEKTQIIFIDFEWLGVGQARCGFVVDGRVYYTHKFDGANKKDAVYMRTPVLPLRHKISGNGSQATSSTITCICATVMSEGETDVHTRPRSVSSGNVAIVPPGANWTILKGIRQSSNSPSRTLHDLQCDVVCTDNNAIAEVRIILAPTVTGGSLSWADVGGGSFVEEATGNASVYAVGGILREGFYVSGRTSSGTNSDHFLDLGFTANGVQREIFVCARVIAGTPDLHAIMNWGEA